MSPSLVAVLVATASAVLLLALLRVGFPVRVPPRSVEKALALKLPLSRPLKPAGEVRVTAVRLDARDAGDRLFVSADVAVSAFSGLGTLEGTLLASGAIRWSAPDGSLFVDGTRLEAFSVNGLPDVLSRLVAEAVTALARELLEGRPVHRLEGKTRVLALARALVRDVAVRRGALELRIGGRRGLE